MVLLLINKCCSSCATIASLHNMTAETRGWQNACVWQRWQGYCLHVLLSLIFTFHVFCLSQKNLFKGRWSLMEFFFKQNYSLAWHARFAIFFPLPSSCISSLMLKSASCWLNLKTGQHAWICFGVLLLPKFVICACLSTCKAWFPTV